MTIEIKNQSWWRRRNPLEKKLLLISIVAILLAIALIISLIVISSKTKTNKDDESSEIVSYSKDVKDYKDVCLSPGCINAASKILEKLDLDVKPCDDFYTFACGGFLKNTVIPDDEVSVNTISLIDDVLKQQLRLLISEKSEENEIKPLRLAKDLYKACMNKTRIEERGLEPIMSKLKKLGGWPVLLGYKWNERSWSWEQAVKDLRKSGFGTSSILTFSIATDFKNSSKRIIYIDEGSLSLDREYLIKGLNDKIVQAYYKYMIDVAVIYGANRDVATRELKDSLDFEFELANISLSQEERRDDNLLYNPKTIRELQILYPYIDWKEYINALLPNNLYVDENEIIVVRVPKYFQELGKLFIKTNKRTIANYMMWRVISFSSLLSIESLRKRSFEYQKAANGIEEQEPRWKECIDLTSGTLYISIGASYVKRHFQENSKREMVEIVNGIKVEFENILKNVKWMDDVTRERAEKKLKSITAHIGYPDEIMDNNKLEEFFTGLEIDSERYFESVLNLIIFGTDFAYKNLRKPVNKTEWIGHAHAANVNAYYNPVENSIEFPAGILQGQFFSAERPRYMNYGAIGSVVGHEITHGFDDQGKQFDENGNLENWWQKDTAEAYLEKAKCIIDQYNNFTESMTGLNLNGINTQGENIADNGGFKESYNAYKAWVEVNGPEPKLPGLDYSPEQLFWISVGQTWCSINRPETMKNSIATDEHAPAQFRILGPLKNLVDFSKDFNCPLDSPMNPTVKCEVW